MQLNIVYINILLLSNDKTDINATSIHEWYFLFKDSEVEQSALFYACDTGRLEVVESLLSHEKKLM